MVNFNMRKGLCIAGMTALAAMGSMKVLAADASPVLKVTFDEEDARDSSGNGNHGTITGNPEFTEGMRGKAIHLVNPDGVAGEYEEARQYVNFGEPDDLKFGSGDFSILFWYQSDGTDSEEVAVIGNKDWNSGGNEGLTIADFRNGMGLNFTPAGSGRLDTDRITEATDHTWHHIAAVFDRDASMTLYVDGNKMAEKDISAQKGKSIDVTDFVLGADGFKRFGVKDSYIDELEVYKYAFSQEEIQEMDAPYLLLKTIADYEESLKNSSASQEKKTAFEAVLKDVKKEAEQVSGAEAVNALLARLAAAYNELVRPEKGIVEFDVLSDVHIRQNSDTEANSAHLIDALNNINEMFPDTLGVMNCGDFSDYGEEGQAAEYFSILKRFGGKIPEFMTALGNHDVRWRSGWPEIYERYMRHNADYMGDTDGKVYYDKWLGGYHFLVLNTEWDLKDRAYISDAQIQWLDEKVAENASDDKPVFILLHQAMRDTYFNSNDWSVGVQDHEIKEVLRKYPNVILFTGHIHNGLGACDVIETDYGAMVDVPSFYYNDGGGQARGQIGYHVTVYEDRVQLSMYDYRDDVFLPEYDHTILTNRNGKKKSKVLEVNFDDGTADDVSGNQNNGTVAGFPEFGKGVKGKALHLVNDESVAGEAVKAQQYVDFGKAAGLRLGKDDFSILFWYKGNAEEGNDCSILSNKDWNTGANQGFTIGAFGGSNNGMSLNFTAEGSGRADTGRFAKAIDGNWHRVAATFDRDGEMTLYIDGQKAGSADISGQQGNSIDVEDYGLVLGADGNLQFGVKDAWIDELSVYQALLGPGEIESAYQPYQVEAGARDAEIFWESDGVTEPAYVLLNGEKNQDVASGAGRITLTGLEPETKYQVLIVTREKSNARNYQDAFAITFQTEPLVASEAQKQMLRAICDAYVKLDLASYTRYTAEALKAALTQAADLLQQERISEEEVREAADRILKAATALTPDIERKLQEAAAAVRKELEAAKKELEAAKAEAADAKAKAKEAQAAYEAAIAKNQKQEKKCVITTSKNSYSVKVGKKVKIGAKASNKNGSKITYKSSNKKIATVNKSGVIKGVKKGTAKITIRCSGAKKVITVRVK